MNENNPELKEKLYALNERYWDVMDELARIVVERAVIMEQMKEETHE